MLLRSLARRAPRASVPGQDPWVVPMGAGRHLLVLSSDANSAVVGREYEGTAFVREHLLWRPARRAGRQQLWAPELHEVADGEYAIYVAASDGCNRNHRMYALCSDRLTGPYTEVGKVCDPAHDVWAIDLTVFMHDGTRYAVWSGWEGADDGFPQNLYIAPMSDPWTISGERRLLARPELSWEMSRAPILEGPQVYRHEGRLLLLYSADASWTEAYKMGALVWTSGPVLDGASWTRVERPLLLGGGHGSVVTVGGHDWLVYHRKTTSEPGWADREVRWTRVEWDAAGLPVFGTTGAAQETRKPTPEGRGAEHKAQMRPLALPTAE